MAQVTQAAQVAEVPLTTEEKKAQFLARIDRGEKIEANDWMPDDYRQALIRLIAMHGISEIMGAFPEKEWVPKAPTLHRKLAIMAKVQDEMGHGQLLIRVAEDLMRPLGKTREHIMQDLFAKRQRFHNVFHMEAPTWADAAVIAWLVDGAAILTQTMLLEGSYAPYARALKRVVQEESFHAKHGESLVLALAEGNEEQRAMLQESINRWWEPLLMFFGPASKKEVGTTHQDINTRYKLRSKSNEELRQEFLSKYVPHIWQMGMTVPDEALRYDEKEGAWHYAQPDWGKFRQIIDGNGPCSEERIRLRQASYEYNCWVREALGAEADVS